VQWTEQGERACHLPCPLLQSLPAEDVELAGLSGRAIEVCMYSLPSRWRPALTGALTGAGAGAGARFGLGVGAAGDKQISIY